MSIAEQIEISETYKAELKKAFEAGLNAGRNDTILKSGKLCELFRISRGTLSKWKKSGHPRIGKMNFIESDSIALKMYEYDAVRYAKKIFNN